MTRYLQERDRLMKLNPHLRSYQRRKITGFCIKLFVLEAIIIALAVYLSCYIDIAWVYGVCFGLVLPWFIFKPQRLFGRVGVGSIVEIEHDSRTVSQYKGAKLFYSDLHHQNVMICCIKNTSGRKIDLEYHGRYARTFFEDDVLVMLPFVAHPINLTPHDWIACCFCGNIMPYETKICIGCYRQTVRVKTTDKEEASVSH